jgi:hypothetical protein
MPWMDGWMDGWMGGNLSMCVCIVYGVWYGCVGGWMMHLWLVSGLGYGLRIVFDGMDRERGKGGIDCVGFGALCGVLLGCACPALPCIVLG